jgi:hypothetical protein
MKNSREKPVVFVIGKEGANLIFLETNLVLCPYKKKKKKKTHPLGTPPRRKRKTKGKIRALLQTLPMATPLVAHSVQLCHHHSKQYSFKSQSRVNRDIGTKTLLGVYNGFHNVYNQSYFHKPWAPIRVLEPNSRFLQMGPQETCSSRGISKKSMSSEGSTSTSSSSISQQVSIKVLLFFFFALLFIFFYAFLFCMISTNWY